MNSPTPTPPTWQAHARRGLTRALLAFVLISIGYAIGTHTRRSPQPECMPLKEDAHVRVDILYDHFSPRWKAIVNIAGNLNRPETDSSRVVAP